MKKQIQFISQTAVMLALLIVVQMLTRSLPTYITGSLVNAILLLSTFLIGLNSGLLIALTSPFLAFMLGIGPAFIQILFFVAIANALIVTLAWLLAKDSISATTKTARFKSVGALSVASLVKMSFLWLGLVKFALPLIPGLKEGQIKVISASFSWPQLVTALIGSALAIFLVPLLKSALKK